MPVQASCPHCATPCLIAEQYLGQVVRCFKCARTFRLVTPSPARRTEPPSTIDADDLLMPTFDVEPPARTTTGLTLEIGCATTTGKVRKQNEDALLVRRQSWSRGNEVNDAAVLAVVDGMGGYGGGEQASALAVQALQASLAPWFDAGLAGRRPPQATPLETLGAVLNDASKSVFIAAQGNPNWKGMGAAAVVALLSRNMVHFGHVGDCRAYHVHEGELRQVTKDQTLVQRMLDLGTLKIHEAAHHPAKNELSQALGRRPDVAPEFCQLTLSRGDWLILASDGLHAHLGHDELRKEIALSLPAAPLLAGRLIEVANQRGGVDNRTVIVVHCLVQ